MKDRVKIVFFIALIVFLALPAHAQRGLSLIRDTEIETILKQWANPIFKSAELDPAAVNIILVNSDSVNAFVAGGSNIFFYTGLLQKTENPGEVIGVLAHETGHITGGHLIRGRDALQRASYESIIGTILGIGVAVLSGEAGAVTALSAGGSTIAQRGFLAHSRIQESSADQAAITFLEQAKINPTGLASFMEKLKGESFVPETQQSEYIRTHPLVDNRIAALNRRINQSAHLDKPYPAQWREQHARMKAKLLGFISPGQIPWLYDDQDRSIAADYARTIAAYREDRDDVALEGIENLLKQEPKNPYFHELKGQMLVDFGRVEDALPAYRDAVQLLPDAALFRIALAHALIESARHNEAELLNEAIKHLEIAQQSERRSGRLHRLLATAYGRTDRDLHAKIHLAEEALLQRRLSFAKQHAKTVLNTETAGSALWLKAQDILSFIETVEKG